MTIALGIGLAAAFNRTIQTAIEIGAKRRPVELLTLPLGRMAGGISEALITTRTGLLVAIPGLYLKGFLDRRARNLKQRIAAAGFYLRGGI